MKRILYMLVFAPHVIFSQVWMPPERAQLRAVSRDAWTASSTGGDSLASVIVEFREAPLFIARRTSVAAADAGFYDRRFNELVTDLNGSVRLMSGAPSRMSLRKKFYKAFFGASVDVHVRDIPLIEKLPYVKAVHADQTVQAHLETSIPKTRTDTAWKQFGVTGAGVRVGMLDTGVDYMHPALGGGFGRGYKVAGGYDIVNGDVDPMDDNGHGTHVAGIIAARSAGVTGFAPDATLIAYKVLDAQGKGKESDIIDAIERTVDPNGDGDDADHLDVVNVSLGSDNGDPGDAKSTAVDQASALGVTFCISAGNSGRYAPVQGKEDNYYFTAMETISSPGCARSAITVGAVDAADRAADFSSKGPSAKTFGIKPDITAPGVGIHSLASGGGLTYKSGTSMAAPMVAGMAALIKSLDARRTPAEIKSALVNSSIDLGLRPMQQGAGRVDAVRALTQQTFAFPSALHYGFDDPSQARWVAAETLRITNRRPRAQLYAVSFAGTRAGIGLSAQPQSFTLEAGASRDVIVTLAAENAVLPLPSDDILVFEGAAVIAGGDDTLRIPWAFTRATQMLLTFAEDGAQFVGGGNEYMITPSYSRTDSKIVWTDKRTARVIGVIPDAYAFAVYYPSLRKLVTKARVDFPGRQRVDFPADEARFALDFNGVDENGTSFRDRRGAQRVLRVDLPTSLPLYIPFAPGQHSIAVSPSSSEFTFHGIESLTDLAGAKRAYLPQYAVLHGIASDASMTNDPSRYRKQTVRFQLPFDATRAKIYSEIDAVVLDGGRELFNPVVITADTVDAVQGLAAIDLFVAKPIDPVYGSSIRFHVSHSDPEGTTADYSSSNFTVVNDSIMAGFASGRSLASVLSPAGGTMTIGGGPVSIVNLSYNNASGTSIQFDPRFRGPAFEDRYTDALTGTYAIANSSGERLFEGRIAEAHAPFAVAAGKYTIRYDAETHDVGDIRAHLSMTNRVDLTKTVPDAPYFTSMRIVDGRGAIVGRAKPREALTLQFSSKVYAYPFQLPVPESTSVSIRAYGSAEWVRLPVRLVGSDVKTSGSLFASDLPPASLGDSTAVDLRVRVADALGNSSEIALVPAIAIGNWKRGTITDIEAPRPAAAYTFALGRNYPNPFNPSTTIVYELAERGHAELAVFDVLGRRVATLAERVHAPGRYTAVFNASALASGVYICRLMQGARSAVNTMMVVK